jgi:phage/plasmid-associated DNA primase
MSENLEFLASAVATFVSECCEVGPEHQVLLGTAYLKWREWCSTKGVRYAWMENQFSEKLKAAVPTVTTARPRKDNPKGHPTMLIGIRLRKRFYGSGSIGIDGGWYRWSLSYLTSYGTCNRYKYT